MVKFPNISVVPNRVLRLAYINKKLRFHSQLNNTFRNLYVFAQIFSRLSYRSPFFLLCNEIKNFVLKK